MTAALALKLFGAALAFAFGIWAGLGMPGIKKDDGRIRRSRPSNYLHGTWLNRLFFGMPRPPRRFGSSRFLPPSDRGRHVGNGDAGEAGENGDREQGRGKGERKPVVRLRDL